MSLILDITLSNRSVQNLHIKLDFVRYTGNVTAHCKSVVPSDDFESATKAKNKLMRIQLLHHIFQFVLEQSIQGVHQPIYSRWSAIRICCSSCGVGWETYWSFQHHYRQLSGVWRAVRSSAPCSWGFESYSWAAWASGHTNSLFQPCNVDISHQRSVFEYIFSRTV